MENNYEKSNYKINRYGGDNNNCCVFNDLFRKVSRTGLRI